MELLPCRLIGSDFFISDFLKTSFCVGSKLYFHLFHAAVGQIFLEDTGRKLDLRYESGQQWSRHGGMGESGTPPMFKLLLRL